MVRVRVLLHCPLLSSDPLPLHLGYQPNLHLRLHTPDDMADSYQAHTSPWTQPPLITN